MQLATPDEELLRRLAETRLERALVLSLYLNLDPSEFATPPARATAVRSLLDSAERALREREGLEHDDRVQLQAGLEQARSLLTRELDADASPALAVFACEPENLLEAVALPRPVQNRVTIDRSPLIGPLTGMAHRERWCVVLVSRQDARVLRGSPDGLREVEKVHDPVHGQHDQGGWSQARYQRSVDKEVADHLKHAAERLLRHFKRQPFERLVVGGPREVAAEFEGKLHGYLGDRLAGRIEVDVETSTPEQVLAASRECFEAHEEQREDQVLERLDEGARGVAGLENVLRPLNERRVEALLLDEAFSASGTLCPRCGWLGPEGEERCPADGAQLEACDDVAEKAIELAIQQSAEVLRLRRRREQLGERGGVGALLRF